MKIIEENGCIRVETPLAELERLGLDRGDFYKGSIEAQIFISAVIAMLRSKGINAAEAAAVTSFSGDTVVLRLYPLSKACEAAFCFGESTELADFCRETLCKTDTEIMSSQIYALNGSYILLITAEAVLLKNDEIKAGCIADPIICAKIKEYGRLLCDTPVNTLF